MQRDLILLIKLFQIHAMVGKIRMYLVSQFASSLKHAVAKNCKPGPRAKPMDYFELFIHEGRFSGGVVGA